MQQIYALRVANQDRPKVFQAIVTGLFFLSLCTIVVCCVYLLQTEKTTTGKTQTEAPNTNLAQQPFRYPSSHAVFREQK